MFFGHRASGLALMTLLANSVPYTDKSAFFQRKIRKCRIASAEMLPGHGRCLI
jgi:hypothetical protein